MKRIKLLLLLIVLGAIGAALLLPWKSVVETRLRQMLAERGLPEARFTVERLDTEGIVLKDIALGEGLPFALDTVTLGYSVRALARGDLDDLAIARVTTRAGDTDITLHDITLRFTPQAASGLGGGIWRGDAAGTWTVREIQVENESFPIPPLAASGTFEAGGGDARLGGEVTGGGGQYRGDFTLAYRQESKTGTLTVKDAVAPWGGGTLAASQVAIPIGDGKSVRVPLKVARVSLQELMGRLTGGRAEATGTVSGTLPVVIHPGGGFTVETGGLTADGEGTIRLAPDAIPGDNQQIDTVRQVLRNFQYSRLAMDMKGGAQGALSVDIAVEGRNPDAFEGRPVKLNVHLTGDVLSLIQQSVLPIADPKSFLKDPQ